MSKPKVVVAMSGGVDSSVTAALLKKAGYECIGMHLNFWVDPVQSPETERIVENKCCTLEGLNDARRVCGILDMPFYVMNVVDSFKEKVVDEFLDMYGKGETPNPCIACNRNIKFGQLLNRAKELGAQFLATGHYAKIEEGNNGKKVLKMARDKEKDQSYFLYHLSQEKMQNIFFPLGDLLKSEVYDLAREFGLVDIAEKQESQGLCFFPESKPIYFLKRYLPKEMFEAGDIVTLDGRVIGAHKGLPLYTIGQRQGLGIGGIHGEPEGMPWYVIEINRASNRLIVGREEDIFSHSLVCDELEWVSGEAPHESKEIEVRIRHRAQPIPARLKIEKGFATVESKKRMKGIAAGQAAVFYKDEELLGGGVICGSRISYRHDGQQKENVVATK